MLMLPVAVGVLLPLHPAVGESLLALSFVSQDTRPGLMSSRCLFRAQERCSQVIRELLMFLVA